MKLQILGRGCPNCKELKENTREAAEELEVGELEIEEVYDLEKASRTGMMSPPGLAIDGELVSQGSVLSTEEIVELVEER